MNISIIIPVFNRRSLLRHTVETIPESYRLIIVDNGSVDGSYDEAVMLAAERKNTTVITEPTPGAAAARNAGLRCCDTEWIYFFDSDDDFEALPSEWDEEMDMVCFPVNMTVNGRTVVRDYKPVDDTSVHIINSMLDTVSMIFRTEWLRSIGGWNNNCRIWDDWELGMRALLNKPRLQWLTQRAFHNIKVHGESLTGNGLGQRWQAIADTMVIAIDDVVRMDLDENDKKSALTALFYRTAIIIGTMSHEGDKCAIDGFSAKVSPCIESALHPNVLLRLNARLLTTINRYGHGAWRVAMYLIG